ncbi:MAG TPA: hypothetical protein VMM12_01945 [Longimicrobiales bacterium]|nr:hypothetical protein [Longimicrobiales bacterium]
MKLAHAAKAAVLAGLVPLAGCGPKHHLADYDFANRSLAVVTSAPAYPELHTGGVGLGGDNPVQAVLQAGSRVAKEVEARRARARLDSAATMVDVGRRMGGRTADRASRYLAARPVETAPADFTLEVWVTDFGLDARAWDAAAYLFTNAEAVLIDGASGREVWSVRVWAREPVTPAVFDTGPVPSDAITAGSLMAVSVEDFQRVLERLADLSSDLVTSELRGALRDVRRR